MYKMIIKRRDVLSTLELRITGGNHFELDINRIILHSHANVVNVCLKLLLSYLPFDTEKRDNTTTHTVHVNGGEMEGNEYCTFFTCKEHTPDKRLSSHPGSVGCSYIRNVCS